MLKQVYRKATIILVGIFISFGCNEKQKEKPTNSFNIAVKELSDKDYPDNPDIENRSGHYFSITHPTLSLKTINDSTLSFTFLPGNEKSDTIIFPKIAINTFLPNVPEWVRQDAYLTKIGIINQEWNRQQVKFRRENGYFEVKGNSFEQANLVRADIARNCLNSGLWEIILYTKENDKQIVYYHGWFDFPLDLYEQLFDAHTKLSFDKYKESLVHWKDPKNKKVDLNVLRSPGKKVDINYASLNHHYYPLTGARIWKEKNILVPKDHNVIQDFLTDSTLFSTFSPPGYYNTKEPRKTELSLLATLKEAHVHEISNKHIDTAETLYEFDLVFNNIDSSKNTHLVFGGIDINQIPRLPLEKHNEGHKMPMGIANHSFYESYETALQNKVTNNPYYGLILDENGNWLDSHAVGIDGPLFFWDAEKKELLHIMILSFERHAFVGHYTIQINEPI